jgi:hypothetical protein
MIKINLKNWYATILKKCKGCMMHLVIRCVRKNVRVMEEKWKNKCTIRLMLRGMGE